ncbi:sprT-like domain-containing protein Spartan [Lingula anatina]|uniref:Protein with SprT-like domain at the N terminus n=1 Tax=Lingula anatina TaxID=7574 RepID=A0A1S3KFH4_LINAN|nr:sprT-like domain-containing protein Spartan [Lingula anatina]|eukprot:XP_013421237.1 sprT-like domain-containing protein Spartan [Lingula anatina]
MDDFALALKLQEQYDRERCSTSKSGGPTSDDMTVNDTLLAKQLQEQFNQELPSSPPSSSLSTSSSSCRSPAKGINNKTISLVDERWELLDPNPDARALFLEFNDTYFWGRLAGVEVRWSPRMTLCAGLCCYEGRGGLCSIRLSLPLLKLRPRKDLVETLLHEMIHAYLFVTDNNKDHDGHGPEFCKHMNRINKETGTSISIYHSFHDEVDNYRQHWWKCDGPCQKRKPYFGMVRRAMNRAPSPRDPWWADHQRTCGGTYHKIKEPEDYGKKKGKKTSKDSTESETKEVPDKKSKYGADIREMFKGKGILLGSTAGNSSTNTTEVKPTLPKLNSIENHSKSPESVPGSSTESTNSSNKPECSSSGMSTPTRDTVINARKRFLDNLEKKAIPKALGGGQLQKKPKHDSNAALGVKKPKYDIYAALGIRKTNHDEKDVNLVNENQNKSENQKKNIVLPSETVKPSTKANHSSGSSSNPHKDMSDTGAISLFSVSMEESSKHGSCKDQAGPSSHKIHEKGMNLGSMSSFSEKSGQSEPSGLGQSEMTFTAMTKVPCPVCSNLVMPSDINRHLDSCLM